MWVLNGPFHCMRMGVLRLCPFWSDMQPRFQEISLHVEETLVTRLHETDYEHLQRICVLLLDPFPPAFLKILLLFQRVSKLGVPRVFLID